jgi:hypothetical protein
VTTVATGGRILCGMRQSDPNRLSGRTWYRIQIRGHLSERFADAFRGMTLVPSGNETVLVGVIEDQAHLFGVLDRIRDLGLDLVSVEPDGERDLAR